MLAEWSRHPQGIFLRAQTPSMLFNSFTFLIFFPIVVAIYFAIPHRLRWAWLLAASCYFYMAFIPVYILILFFTIAVDYTAGILIENSEGRRRRSFLIMSIVANVGVLAIFKYFNFLTQAPPGPMRQSGKVTCHPSAEALQPEAKIGWFQTTPLQLTTSQMTSHVALAAL